PATLRIVPASLAQEFAPESASPGVDPLNAASVWFLDNPRKFEPRPQRQYVLGRMPTEVKAGKSNGRRAHAWLLTLPCFRPVRTGSRLYPVTRGSRDVQPSGFRRVLRVRGERADRASVAGGFRAPFWCVLRP